MIKLLKRFYTYCKDCIFVPKDIIKLKRIDEVTSEVNSLFDVLTDLLNSPEFNRFDVYDYYTKKTRIHTAIALINSLMIRYKSNELDKNIIVESLLEIKQNNKYYDNIILALNECISKTLNNQKIFIVLRNTIAQEWINRNIMESNFKPKDLNVLDYTFEDYVKHLENCKHMIVYDVEKFINRYGRGHSKYIEVETDIRKSINALVYKKVSFDKIDTAVNELLIFSKKPKKYCGITLRGWFKADASFEEIKTFKLLKYTAYSKSK